MPLRLQAAIRLAATLLPIGAVVAAGGCVGSGEGVPAPTTGSGIAPRTWPEIQKMILTPACAQQCHRGGAAPKALSLEPNRALKQLVGVPSVEVPSMLRVAPGSPEKSFLLTKVVSSDPRRVGARMPRNGPPFLSFAQVRSLRLWIAAGATADWVMSEVPEDAGGPMVNIDAGGIDDVMAAEVTATGDAL